MLVAPALHLHPTTDTILRYLSPEIDWEVLGIDEHWREESESCSERSLHARFGRLRAFHRGNAEGAERGVPTTNSSL
jgi:hypothetical protein